MGSWFRPACGSCGRVLVGASVPCTNCRTSMHATCVREREGLLLCAACSSDFDAAVAQSRIAAAAAFGARSLQHGSHLAGQMIGSAATASLGAASSLVGGLVQGTRSTVQAALQAPPQLPTVAAVPRTPTVAIEELPSEDGGSVRGGAPHGRHRQEQSGDLSVLAVEMRAMRAVISDPDRTAACTTRQLEASAAMMRLRLGNRPRPGLSSGTNSETSRPDRRMRWYRSELSRGYS